MKCFGITNGLRCWSWLPKRKQTNKQTNKWGFYKFKKLLGIFLRNFSLRIWVHINSFKSWAEEKVNHWGKWIQNSMQYFWSVLFCSGVSTKYPDTISCIKKIDILLLLSIFSELTLILVVQSFRLNSASLGTNLWWSQVTSLNSD